MPSETDTSFRLILSHREEMKRGEQSDESMFWLPFLRVAADSDREASTELTPHVLESRIRRQFPVRLKDLIKSQITSAETKIESERAILADRLVVRINEISYSSIDLSVAIEPLDALITLFDGKFEYFEAFLHTYVPLAFRDALHPEFGRYYGQWADIVYETDLSIRPSTGLVQSFGAPRHMPTPSATVQPQSVKQQYAQWLWIAANTSLVIPTILAAFFLYLGWQTIDKRFSAIDGASMERMRALIPEKSGSSPTTQNSAAPSVSGAAGSTKP